MGILAMVAALALLILVHELGHWAVAQWRGMQTPVFSIGFGSPYIVIGRWRNTEFRLSPWLLGGYVSIPELADETTVKEWMTENKQDPAQFKQFAIWEKSVVAIAGVTMNVIIAVVLMFGLFATVGRPDLQVRDVYVADLDQKNPIARNAGLQPGDIILSVDGQPVKTPQELSSLLSARKSTLTQLAVQRGNQALTIPLTPNQDGRIGIMIGTHVDKRYERMGVGESAVASVTATANMSWQMVKGLAMMLHIIPPPDNVPDGATDVRGVISIVQIGAWAFNDGLYSFIVIVVLISLNLALMNILPIPALDGGYLLFFAVEAIRGKPLPRELQQKILMFFFMLLIGLGLLGLYNDLFKPMDLPQKP